MPWARLRSSATASRAPRSSSSSSSRSGESGGSPSRSSRSPTASATRCCWAPSCRSRSIRRRSAVAAATIRDRDACSSALLLRRSTRVAWSASSNARLRSSIASLPATAASARSSAPVNAAASAARSITTSPSTRLPSTAGAKRICGGSGVGGTSRGTHIRSQPGPATPTLASRPRSAAESGIAGGAPSSGAGTIVAHSRSPSSSLPGGPGPDPHARQTPVPTHRLGQRAQQLGHRFGAAGAVAHVGQQFVGRAPHARQRRPRAPRDPPAQRPRERRHEQHPEERRVDQVDLRADREPARRPAA